MRTFLAAAVVVILVAAPLRVSAQSFGTDRSATFLDIFPRDQMTCGRRGWTFTGLINGHVPLTACMLRYRNNVGRSPFGPL